MKHILFLIIATTFGYHSLAQDQSSLSISFSSGILNSALYSKTAKGPYYNLDFDYYISKRHIISADYLAGMHHYFDKFSNTIDFTNVKNGTNAKAHYYIFSVFYKYKLIDQPKVGLLCGAGISIAATEQNYPYQRGNSTSFETSANSDLAFPVSVDLNYALRHNFNIGLKSGFYYSPNYKGILAYYAGPKVSLILP